MKTILSILLTGACVALLIFGQVYWKEKTTINETFSINEDNPGMSPIAPTDKTTIENYLSYTKNWPAESVTAFKAKLEENKPFKIVLLGSNAQGEGKSSWPEMVEAKVADTFGNHIEVSAFNYDVNSSEYLNQSLVDEVNSVLPDLILLEPFTLNDNGEVAIEDSLINISTIMENVKKEQPNAVFILQPPHPIFKASFYPIQVENLRNYADTNGIPFLNHWEAWPDPSTEEINTYLVEDQSQPNEKGHEVWAKFVLDYLIAQ